MDINGHLYFPATFPTGRILQTCQGTLQEPDIDGGCLMIVGFRFHQNQKCCPKWWAPEMDSSWLIHGWFMVDSWLIHVTSCDQNEPFSGSDRGEPGEHWCLGAATEDLFAALRTVFPRIDDTSLRQMGWQWMTLLKYRVSYTGLHWTESTLRSICFMKKIGFLGRLGRDLVVFLAF